MAAILHVVWTVPEHCVFVCELLLASGTADHLHQSPSLFPASFFNLIISTPLPPSPFPPSLFPSVSCRDSLMYKHRKTREGEERVKEKRREMSIRKDEVAPPSSISPLLLSSLAHLNKLTPLMSDVSNPPTHQHTPHSWL